MPVCSARQLCAAMLAVLVCACLSAGLARPVAAADVPAAEAPAAGGEVTYAKDIAPILIENCSTCHRPGEIGPFSLLAYDDAKKRADFIASITADRRMPPWKAAPGFGSFRDERLLSDAQIELIGKWAAAGAPEGDATHLPEAPEHTEGWQLGEPDMILKMPQPFEVPAGGSDVYRCFVIPIPVDEDTMVSAAEFRPGNHAVVHHAIMFLDAHGKGREKEGKDGHPGFESFGGPGVPVTGGLGAWVPGMMPRFLPDGFAKFLQSGSDLVLQIHYHPSGKAETDQSTVGLYFSKKPVKRIVTGIAIVQPDLHIPAGNPHAEVKAQTTPLPADVYVMGISPHMHNLGREIKVVAVDPTGKKTAPLIWIKDWDFNWQGSYQFARPIRLPKGSKIRVQAFYDNSADNPKNPNVPPKDVGWGEQTSDEMCLVSVQVCADTPADLRKIAGMFGHELAAGIEGGVPPTGNVAKRKSTGKTRTASKRPAAGKSRGAASAEQSDGLAGVAALAQKLNGENSPPAAVQAPPAAPDPAAVAGNPPGDESPPAEEQPEKTDSKAKKASAKKDAGGPQIPEGGLPIPEAIRPLYGQIDKDGNGVLTAQEVAGLEQGQRDTLVQSLLNMQKKGNN